ncbi:unnamed protein product [Urochloa humidicola]
MAGEGRPAAARVAVFPLPFQGHITPMLQLAGALHARGLAITVLHTAYNAPDPARHPEFSFVAVPETPFRRLLPRPGMAAWTGSSP